MSSNSSVNSQSSTAVDQMEPAKNSKKYIRCIVLEQVKSDIGEKIKIKSLILLRE